MGGVYSDEGLIVAEDRHPGVAHFAPLFAYAHLPERLRWTSQQCAELAQDMVDTLTDGPELAAGLRKLLEAKDCFVRAGLPSPAGEPVPPARPSPTRGVRTG